MPFRMKAMPIKFKYAKRMRDKLTFSESMLWKHLFSWRVKNTFKWRSQTVILGWIVDFYCPKANLAIEVDGKYHDTPEQRTYDQHKDAVLRSHGIFTLRFSNMHVQRHLRDVLRCIRTVMLDRITLKRRKQITLRYKLS